MPGARDEGGTDGGIVVQDCMQLLNNLLQGNQANQLLFRQELDTYVLPACCIADCLVCFLLPGTGNVNLADKLAYDLQEDGFPSSVASILTSARHSSNLKAESC